MSLTKMIVLLGMMALVLIAGSDCSYRKHKDGILIRLKKQKATDAGLLKIQVCSADIIRVIATPGKSISKRQRLMIEPRDCTPVQWTVKESGDQLMLSTTQLTVKVQRATGKVSFYDADGQPVLKEKTGTSKIITPAEVMGEKTYHVQQIFESSEDEALYGLGQHQNGIMDYKGHDVDLWQYNIVVAVPFLVSSRNYGILWDNNSRTKLGDVRDYRSLSDLKLYGEEGREGGLTAEYFKDSGFKFTLTSRKESRIEYEFIDVHDEFPADFDFNTGSVRWSGAIECHEAGVHKFRLYSSGYVKLWLNGELIVDSWRQNWLPWTHIFSLPMETGKRYPVKIEWVPSGGYIGLKCLDSEEPDNKNRISLYSEVGDQIDYYFIAGDNLDQVIGGYRRLTGRAPLMPKWAMGLWQCRERYRTQEELLSVVREFRRRRIPLDNIVQDWFYWPEDRWGSHEFEASRYPDPAGMVAELHDELHAHIMISVWPKFYVGTEHYDEFKRNGWLYMRNVEKGQRDWVGPGYVSTFYDPYSKGARDLYWRQINAKLYSLGIDAWWLDCTEPDIQSNLSRAETRLRMHPTAMGTAARYRNSYSLMNTEGVYENQRLTNPERRVFILTRSAFPGQQRDAAATWSGDVAARWSDLKAQIPAGLNFCLSGIPYWTTDVGGFAVERRFENARGKDLAEWCELMTRWFQFATFCPLLRVHGQHPYREMFHVAPEDHTAYQAMLAYDKLRYRLMPYIYSLAAMVTHEDYTIMRALVMDFGQDKRVLKIGSQFMFGPALLINPVTKYKARKRAVYLPQGAGWYDLKTGRFYHGGQFVRAPAPYSDIPVFVRAGAIIPFGPEIQYTSEKAADPILLYVYTGQDGQFKLYEDENVNYNYENGARAIIPIRYDEGTRTLTIDEREGEFPGMLKERTFRIIWISPTERKALDFAIKPDTVVKYNGSRQSVKME